MDTLIVNVLSEHFIESKCVNLYPPYSLIFTGNPVEECMTARLVDVETIVDPLFIFLLYFVKSSYVFNPIEKILVDEEHPEINDLLLKLSERTNMRQVAFTKESNKRDACFVVSEYLPSALKESLLECIFSDKQKSNKPNKNNTDQNNKVKHKEIQHDEVPHKVKKSEKDQTF